MREDNVRSKIIKDTVVNTIQAEMKSKLKRKLSDRKKINDMLNLTRSKVLKILESFNKDKLHPRREFESEQDFENHILALVQEVRGRLLDEMEKELE